MEGWRVGGADRNTLMVMSILRWELRGRRAPMRVHGVEYPFLLQLQGMGACPMGRDPGPCGPCTGRASFILGAPVQQNTLTCTVRTCVLYTRVSVSLPPRASLPLFHPSTLLPLLPIHPWVPAVSPGRPFTRIGCL